MGSIREAHLPETQPRDSISRIVSTSIIYFKHILTSIYSRQLEAQDYRSALALIDNLLTELKRLDDKMVLTEVHLLESRVYRGIGNMPKSKVRAKSDLRSRKSC